MLIDQREMAREYLFGFLQKSKSLFPNPCSHCNSSERCSNRQVSSRLTPFSSTGAGFFLIIGVDSVNIPVASDVVTEWSALTPVATRFHCLHRSYPVIRTSQIYYHSSSSPSIHEFVFFPDDHPLPLHNELRRQLP